MKRVKYLISLFIIISIFSCEEEKYYNILSPSIKIIEPLPKFIAEEYDYLYIQIETNIDESEIERIELIVWGFDLFEDTLITIIEQKPFEKYLYIPKMCVEDSYIFLCANLILKSGKELNSEILWGYVFKNLPANNEMDIYNYEGFDNDSTLVAKGTFSIVKGYWPPGFDNTLLGRKDIIAVAGDSTFEKGKGYLEGIIDQNGQFSITLTPCGELPVLQSMGIAGNWLTDSLLDGIRYYSPDHGPITIKLGTFKAVKRN